ncbi:MAG: radical SAM protein [Acidobacteriaceae bacterium]
MDLLLTHGYFLSEDAKERQIMKPYVPLGILYICSHLRQKGHDVEVFDSTFSSLEQLYARLTTGQPAVLGVYANLMTRGNVVKIIQAAKAAGWKVVAGGPEPGAYSAEYLAAGADVVVLGEGELVLEELLPTLKGGPRDVSALSKVEGIAFIDDDGQVRQTGMRAQIADLDAQPWPARDAVDISQYLGAWRQAHGQGSVSFITARGCPYKCRWCSHQVFGQTHRRRNPLAVVDEVEWLAQRYQPDMLWIADDVFTIHHGWLRQYAAEMRRRGLHLAFECISRADRLNPETVDLLAELGCFRLWVGSESGSQRILDAMERGVRVEQVQQAVAMCKQRGIQTGMFLMWGYEGEETSDINETIEHVKKANPDIFFTTVAYPIKGTPYYRRIEDQLVKPERWAQSSDREIRVKGRHSRQYYQYADQLLRDEVALARLRRQVVPEQTAIRNLEASISSARFGLDASFAEVEA